MQQINHTNLIIIIKIIIAIKLIILLWSLSIAYTQISNTIRFNLYNTWSVNKLIHLYPTLNSYNYNNRAGEREERYQGYPSAVIAYRLPFSGWETGAHFFLSLCELSLFEFLDHCFAISTALRIFSPPHRFA